MIRPTPHFEVTRAWLHAIGQRHYDGPATFEVTRHWRAGRLTFADLRVPWQASPMIVAADWRGRFV